MMYKSNDINKILDYLLDNVNSQIDININYYHTKLKYLSEIKKIEMKKKPNKIFRKRYDTWEKNIENIDKEIDTVLLEINKEFDFAKKNSPNDY